MKLSEYLSVLRSFWRSILAITVAGVAAAVALSVTAVPTYSAATSLFFSAHSGSSAGDLTQGSSYAETQVISYSQLATKALVLQPVIDKLQLKETPESLASKVSVSSPESTSLIDITVQGIDPGLTAATADAIGAQLVTAAAQLTPTGDNGQKVVQAIVVNPAKIPTKPTSPKVPLNLTLGLLIGLSAGIIQAGLREALDTRVRGHADVARATDSPLLGVIPLASDADLNPVAMEADNHSVRSEAYRKLRTNLKFLPLHGASNAMVITSSVPGEGKSMTAINIARSMADAGLSVLLIDGDLRKPKLATYLGLEGSVGLTSVLIGEAALGEVVQHDRTPGLYVLAAGPVPPNPSELLDSQAMVALLASANHDYDSVVIDAPPVLPVTDPAILASLTAGALLVIGSGTTRRPEVAAAIEALEGADGVVLGVILNKYRASGQSETAAYNAYYGEKRPTGDHGGPGKFRPAVPPKRAAVHSTPPATWRSTPIQVPAPVSEQQPVTTVE